MYLTDNDLYKFTMMQAVYHQFPGVKAEYEFFCRNGIEFTKRQYKKIYERIIYEYCGQKFLPEELTHLSSLRFMKEDFIDFLRLYRPDKRYIKILYDTNNRSLSIKVSGPWLLTILFEVPILSIVSEVLGESERLEEDSLFKHIEERALEIKNSNLPISDFGTRRRFSFDFQRFLLSKVFSMNTREKLNKKFPTSNVFLANIYDLPVIGTMAHEWIMAGAGISHTPLVDSQKYMLEKWVQEYRGDLGIALTDTYGIDAFLKDFDLYFAKLYDGLRHDSGNPYTWGEKVIAHYKKLKIDPKTKTLVFSDGLNIKTAKEIYDYFKDSVNVSFGIGTYLTNPDLLNYKKPQIVMKLTNINGRPVAKLSDTPGKEMCKDPEFLSYVKKVFKGNN